MSEMELGILERLYTFRRKSEVVNFLVNNPLLISFLQEAYEHIRDYFKESQVALEVITDPETGDQELVIFICTNLPPDEVYKKLEQLDEEWWLDAPASAREKLCIEVELN
ncbi:MAG: hypothetical protein ACXQTS_04025 [Candidatus Methanospirareceae archaeon]